MRQVVLPPEADFGRPHAQVCSVPEADVSSRNDPVLNRVWPCDQLCGYFESKRIRCLEIDHRFEANLLNVRHVARIGACTVYVRFVAVIPARRRGDSIRKALFYPPLAETGGGASNWKFFARDLSAEDSPIQSSLPRSYLQQHDKQSPIGGQAKTLDLLRLLSLPTLRHRPPVP